MTDNVTLNAGTGGDVIAADDIGGVKYQRVKATFGADGSATDVSSADPLPVTVSALPLPSGAATAARQDTGNTTLGSILTALGSPLQAGGSVSISGSVGVTGTFWQAVQPVSGTVTANAGSGTFAISAVSLPLPSGAATAALQTTGNTSLGNLEVDIGAPADAAYAGTGSASVIAALKGVYGLLAAPLPAGGNTIGTVNVAGTVPVSGPLTDAQLRATAVPVTMPNMTSATYNQTGVIAINTDLLVIDCQGLEGVSIQCSSMGTAGVVTPAWSNDNTNFIAATILTQAGATATTFNAAGLWTTPVLARYLRLRLTTATTAGTTTLAVAGIAQAANFPVAAQPVSGTVAISGSVALATGANTIGNLTRVSGFTDSSTALAANATFTGTGRVTTSGSYTRFVGTAFADQAGTLFIDLSVDTGTTYRQIASVAVAANVAQQLAVFVTGAAAAATLYRVRYTNGATLQGAFQISSAFEA